MISAIEALPTDPTFESHRPDPPAGGMYYWALSHFGREVSDGTVLVSSSVKKRRHLSGWLISYVLSVPSLHRGVAKWRAWGTGAIR